MRIYGPNGATPAAPTSNARRSSSSGFSLPNLSETNDSRPAAAPVGVSSIDALPCRGWRTRPSGASARSGAAATRSTFSTISRSAFCPARSIRPQCSGCGRLLPISRRIPATTDSILCWPRSNCASRWSWQKPEAFELIGQFRHCWGLIRPDLFRLSAQIAHICRSVRTAWVRPSRPSLHSTCASCISDIVCHESPLYKRRARGTFLLRRDGRSLRCL